MMKKLSASKTPRQRYDGPPTAADELDVVVSIPHVANAGMFPLIPSIVQANAANCRRRH